MNRLYCDADFLETFLKNAPQPQRRKYIGQINEQKSITIWNRYMSMFQSKHFFIDITETDLIAKAETDECWEEIAFAKTEGEIHLDCIGSNFPLKSNDEMKEGFCGIYFSSLDKGTIDSYRKKYGILIIDKDDIKKDLFLKDSGNNITKDECTNWREQLKHKTSTCNSLILIDNYILSNKSNKKEEEFSNMIFNLFPILDVLLPCSLNIPFHLSIVYFKDESKEDYKDENRLQKIKEWITENRPELDVRIGIFQTKKKRGGWKVHDRAILTNCNFIDSGAGFDLFNSENKAINETNTSVLYPFIQDSINWCDDKYMDLLSDISKLTKDAVNNQYVQDYWGEKGNRLLE